MQNLFKNDMQHQIFYKTSSEVEFFKTLKSICELAIRIKSNV